MRRKIKVKYVDLSQMVLFEGLSFEHERITNDSSLFLFDDITFKEFLKRLSKGFDIARYLGVDEEEERNLKEFIDILKKSQFCDVTITYYIDTGDVDFDINNDDLAVCYEALISDYDNEYIWFNLK